MTHEESAAMLFERKRIVGLLLEEYARYKTAGEAKIAHALDVMALKIEHPEYPLKMPYRD